MFKNYLKIAWRSLLTNKVYSLLNILGLAVGMATALLIGVWVVNEYSYDRFLPGYETAYQVKRNFNSNGDTLTFASTSLKLADALRQVPGIEYVAETDNGKAHGLAVANTKLSAEGFQAGSDFLKIFQFPLLQGNKDAALTETYSIVLTESIAKALFGNKNAVGQMVRIDNLNNLKVTGILKDLPLNSSFKFKYIIPFSYFETVDGGVKAARTQSFGANGFAEFVKLKDGVEAAKVSTRIKDIEKAEDNLNAKNSDVILQPLADWHLYGTYTNGKALGGFIDYVRMFSVIGILVLVIACINFVNLTTARSEKRAREVGIRKAIGSVRKQLIFQFLTESALLTFLSFMVSLALVQLAMPYFNSLTGTTLTLPYGNPLFWLVTLSCVAITGILAGSRPAFYLSSFNPVKVLKGTMQVGKSASFSRKSLVVIQFSCSIALIISTIIIYQQIQHARNRPTGYSVNMLLSTVVSNDMAQHYEALKNDLLQSGLVNSVTSATSPATGVYWHSDLDNFPGKQPGETVEMGTILTDAGYFKTLGMQFKEGSNFTGNIAADTNSVILNEAAVKRLRLKQPVGQSVKQFGRNMQIVGVVKDALMDSPFAAADPTTFYYGSGSFLMYRLSPNANPHTAVEKIGAIFNKYNPGNPYTYTFADADYASKFNLEVLVGKLSGIFAALAIFISCLGLFGLAAYIAEQRTKEVGVRKVLGATVAQIWLLLSKEFILLVLISSVIASPIALYLLNNWLQKYSYRISVGPGVFMLAAIAALAITLVTISFQSIKAALSNPIKSLRSE
ncbi:FtsX-like permease family protein [Mucilaginibacter pallidiroseus]|uniref:FtsX-like permease family protein n=1 Tax=Mucilaginibacter pallidiroseus TaxID=2599295 RepID=A0A563UJ33_9SPHI|nr:ABC transporter permease [Mucilaginibacter pallidiroseus]TWR31365.1 FtsX-like permease family protein [Mucilaginibacter pallidiroseus]